MAWVLGLGSPSGPNSCSGVVATHQFRLPRAPPSPALSTYRDGVPTALWTAWATASPPEYGISALHIPPCPKIHRKKKKSKAKSPTVLLPVLPRTPYKVSFSKANCFKLSLTLFAIRFLKQKIYFENELSHYTHSSSHILF